MRNPPPTNALVQGMVKNLVPTTSWSASLVVSVPAMHLPRICSLEASFFMFW